MTPEFAAMMMGHFWWRPAETPDYLISDRGMVLSLVSKVPRFLKPISMGKYLGVQLRIPAGETVKRYVHRLVAEHMHGAAPIGHECRHLDGNRYNNHYTNLAWGTRSENNADKHLHGTALVGEKNPMARLTWKQVERMRRARSETGMTYRELAEKFNVSQMTAYRAVKEQTWK